MDSNNIKKTVQSVLAGTGVTLNGRNPWDPQIKDSRFYARVLCEGSLGLGDSYIEEWWECDQLDEFMSRVMRSRLHKRIGGNWRLFAQLASARLFNLQNRRRAFRSGQAHYDIGNDLYEVMLDKRMVYSCGYWRRADNLEEAQE